MSEAPKRIAPYWQEAEQMSEFGAGWLDDKDCAGLYIHASTLRTVLDMLNSNASRENIRRVIESELGGE